MVKNYKVRAGHASTKLEQLNPYAHYVNVTVFWRCKTSTTCFRVFILRVKLFSSTVLGPTNTCRCARKSADNFLRIIAARVFYSTRQGTMKAQWVNKLAQCDKLFSSGPVYYVHSLFICIQMKVFADAF